MEQGKRDGDPNKNPNQQPKRSKGTKFPVPRPPPRKCPRCESFNTHFCYYNNYNLSQPRYLCNACQRHWTHGGTLRDIPVGGRRRIPKARPGKFPPVSCGESSRSRPPRPPSGPPPPQQEAPPPSKVQFPNVTNMNAMFSGISSGLPPITGANIYPYEIFTAFEGIQMPSFGLMNQPLRIGGGSGSGSGAGVGAGANNNRPIFPRMINNPPMHGPGQPPQADGRGNKNKGKQPMYTPDKNPVLPAGNLNSWTPIGNTNNANGVSTCTTNLWNNIPVLPAGNLNFWTPGRNTNNTNGTSTSSSNLWNNINGASTSNGMNHESSSNPPNNHQDHDAPQ